MQTEWFERTRNETEPVVIPTDDTTGRDDYSEEGIGLTAGTKDIYLGSMDRKALQRREQATKERRIIEKEKWREQRWVVQTVPGDGPSYPPNHFSPGIGQSDGDKETIAATSASSENFATVPYDPTLNGSYPELYRPDSEQKYSRYSQRTHH